MVDTEHIQLAHGGGGQLTAELLRQVVLPALAGGAPSPAGRGGEGRSAGWQAPERLTDSATLPLDAAADGRTSIAFTTDSYVVQPLEFPGGDIGKLAVCGTINDLAVAGAEPKWLSLSLVLEEGLEISLLRRVLASAGAAARDAGVALVTGDTKVVERGGVVGMVVTTSGLGVVRPEAKLGFDRIRAGDRIVLSGPLGEHGLAVMSRRQTLSFSAELVSDCAGVHVLTRALIDAVGDDVRFMRDPTRGGLAATLVEVAQAVRCDVEVEEAAIPVNRTARAAAEMLGLDLLTVANEGKLVAVVAPGAADEAVAALAAHEAAAAAAVIGTVGPPSDGPLVEMVTRVGGRRIIQMPYGEELPRIC